MKFLSRIKKPLTMLVTCSMIMTLSCGFVSASSGGSYKASDAERLHSHVEAQSEGIGVRLMGTPNEKAAAEYIKGAFAENGYDAEIQEYQLPENRASSVAAINIGDKEYYGNYYYSGELDTISDPAVKNFTLTDPKEEDLTCIDGWDVEKGSAVVVNNGIFKKLQLLSEAKAEANPDYQALSAEDFLKMAIEKAEAGDAAALIVYNDETNRSLRLSNVTGNSIPVFAFNRTVGEELNDSKAVTQISIIERGPSWNVYAVKEASTAEPNAIIHVTGHLDSVMGSPGATDNASAVAALLELARLYKDVDTGGVEIRFIAVGGEEGGLNGSRAYVKSLTDEEAAISINFNMDMLSTSWAGADTVSLDINPYGSAEFNIAAALIITGSEDLNLIEGTKNLRWFQYGASDHVSFYEREIDAASMIRTTDETDDIEPVNHTADDSMTANYSKARLEECTNMVSKGIARAIDNKLSKVLIGSIDEKDNQVTVVNAKDLSYLYEAVVFAFELEDGSIEAIDGYADENFSVTAPEGATLVYAEGIGEGIANRAGTFDRPVTEAYSTGLVVKDAKDIPADYTAVDAALEKIPEDLSKYTDDSVNALLDAKDAVVRGLDISKQAEVDAMAKAIEDAISGLEKKATGTTDPADKPTDTPDDKDKPVDKNDKNSGVKTGDESQLALWAVLILVSCGGAFGLKRYAKNRK